MNQRFQQIESLFHAAVELEIQERAAFLDQACGDDGLLRQEVESLLKYKEESESPLNASPVGEVFRVITETLNDSLVEQTLDHYKILSGLGAGGMGEVYAAEDLRLSRKVAIKILPAVFTKDEKQVNRLQQEARAASALNHPNIVTIYELGQADSLHFIAMELVQGETLRQRMRERPLSVRQVLDVAIQVASGLSAAHQAGIIHRDIKPENIMLGNDGYVKILDFGIAKFKEQQALLSNLQPEIGSAGNTQPSAIAGTLSYMSPEQARGEALDARTDIFSLGVLLYEMVAGRRPFDGETREETLQSILQRDAQPLSALGQQVPSDLERIISKALRKNRDERYRSAKEMLTDLREFNEVTDKATDATERANRMLRQYLSIYAVDKRALIPISNLWFIRHSDLERGERGRELLKRSLRRGVLKAGALALLLALVTITIAAAMSVREDWEGVRLSDGHKAAVRRAIFSPDGRLLVSVGEDSKVMVWDFARRERLATLTDHSDWVTAAAFSPDGKWFATGGRDKAVSVWDAARLEKVAMLDGHQGEISGLAFSPDGKMLASSSYEPPDSRTILWSVGQWKRLRELPFGVNGYGNLLFSPDGRQLLSSSSVRGIDVNTGYQITDGFNWYGGNWAAITANEGRIIIASVGGGGSVSFLDLSERKFSGEIRTHQDNGRAMAFSPDGRLAASGAEDIVLWDAATQKVITHLEYTAIVWSLEFSPDGRWLVSTHGDGAILVWDVAERKRVANFNEHGDSVRAVAFSSDGKRIASASEDRSIIIWDAAMRQKEAVLLGHTMRVTAVAFSPDGKWLASSDLSKETIIWDIALRQPRLRLKQGNATYCIAISPDCRWVANSNGVYDSSDGHQIVDFYKVRVGKSEIYGLAFSSNGLRLASVAPYGDLILWDTAKWQVVDQIEMSDANFITVSFSPDGKRLVTGDDQGAVRLWETEPLRQVAVLGHHAARIKSVAFSPDGKQVASAGDDQTIALWDVNRSRFITNIGIHTSPVLSVAFSPDGKQIVSGEHDHSIHIWTRHRTLWGRPWD